MGGTDRGEFLKPVKVSALLLMLAVILVLPGVVVLSQRALSSEPASAPGGEEGAAGPAGTPVYLTEFGGDVQVFRKVQGRWVAAFPNLRLEPEDEVRTGKGSFAVIAFGERAEVRLEAQTHVIIGPGGGRTGATAGLIVKSSSPSPALSIRIGTIWVQVNKSLSRVFDFSVETPTAIAGVRGTVFLVRVAPDGTTTVAVYRGAVEVAAAEGSVLVTGGRGTVVAPGSPPALPGPLDRLLDQNREAALRWLERRLDALKRQLEKLEELDDRGKDGNEGKGSEKQEDRRKQLEETVDELNDLLHSLTDGPTDGPGDNAPSDEGSQGDRPGPPPGHGPDSNAGQGNDQPGNGGDDHEGNGTRGHPPERGSGRPPDAGPGNDPGDHNGDGEDEGTAVAGDEESSLQGLLAGFGLPLP